MTLSDIGLVALVVALCSVVLAAIWVALEWWRGATYGQRLVALQEAVRWAVAAAEMIYTQPKSGASKRAWVLAALRRRFPEMNEAVVADLVETTVGQMQQQKEAERGAHHNGRGPRYVE